MADSCIPRLLLTHILWQDLMHMMLAYLLDVQDHGPAGVDAPTTPSNPPRSPTTLRRRQSLMLLTAPKYPDDVVEPTLFSLVDLILNNVSSKSSQSVFAALKLGSTIIARQKKFAFGTLLRVQGTRRRGIDRTAGALDLELEKLIELTTSLHDHFGLDDAYAGLAKDVRLSIEAQVPFHHPSQAEADDDSIHSPGRYTLSPDDHFLRALRALLRTFFTNSVDVNLALTQAIISIAVCIDIRLDGWFAVEPSSYSFKDATFGPQKPWQHFLDEDESPAFLALKQASRHPKWSDDNAPMIHQTIQALALELDTVRSTVPNLDQLIAGRKAMLQAANLDAPLISSEPPSLGNSPTQPNFLDATKPSRGYSRSSSKSSLARGRNKATTIGSPHSHSLAGSPAPKMTGDDGVTGLQPVVPAKSIFLPPPPPESPSTTDVLMQTITFPVGKADGSLPSTDEDMGERKASLNHVLTNVVLLQEFVLELVAVLQVRAAFLGEKEVKFV